MKALRSGVITTGLLIMIFVVAGMSYAQTKNAAEPQSKQKSTQGTAQPQQPKTLLDFKNELKLTDTQVKEISKIRENLDKETKKDKAKLTLLNSDLEELLKSEGDLNKIKTKLNEAALIQAGTVYLNIEASRKINKLLSPDQIKKWNDIRASKGK